MTALAVLLAMCLIRCAHAQPVAIPEASALYRHRVEQVVADVFGVNGSPARLAAQLHQESTWRAQARSPVGAQGMAQFMPATARWMQDQFVRELGAFDPWNPVQRRYTTSGYTSACSPLDTPGYPSAAAGPLPCAPITAVKRGYCASAD